MANIFNRLALLTSGLSLFCIVLFLVAPSVEGRFFPVVTNFQITQIEPIESGYSRIWGRINLSTERKCDFIGVDFFLRGADRKISVPLVFEEGARDRPRGPSHFGPWRVQLTREQIENYSGAYALHQCPLRFWRTITVLY